MLVVYRMLLIFCVIFISCNLLIIIKIKKRVQILMEVGGRMGEFSRVELTHAYREGRKVETRLNSLCKILSLVASVFWWNILVPISKRVSNLQRII